MKEIVIGSISLGGGRPFVLIAGPCVIESRSQCLEVAGALKEISLDAGVPVIFKSSYDKANRSSHRSFRGPGLEAGLEILAEVKERWGLPVLSDVHCRSEVDAASRVLDVVQIPAFLCRQTDLVMAAARVSKVINVKKGQFMAPWDMKAVVEKVRSAGSPSILVTERGASFGYNNLVVDFRSLQILSGLGVGVVFDATHSLQLPGGLGDRSGGQREFIPALARAAVAVGIDALFMEVHPDPDRALCDGPNSFPLGDLQALLEELVQIDAVVKRGNET